MVDWSADYCNTLREKWRNDPDTPNTLAEWKDWREKSRESQASGMPGNEATDPSKELKNLTVSETDQAGKNESINRPDGLFAPAVPDDASPGMMWTVTTPQALSEARNRMYAEREKDLQTKDGRAKWEAYEKEWNCVGYYEATKKQMIYETLTEKLDMDALVKLAAERKTKIEAEGTKKTSAASSKNKKGKK